WLGINALLLVPFMYAGAVFALAGASRPRRILKLPAARYILANSLAVAALVGPFGVFGLDTALAPRATSRAAQRHAIGLVPGGARVCASSHLALPLSSRRYLYLFPIVKDAQWVVVDSSDDRLPDISF